MYIGSTNNSPSSQGVYSLNAATGALVWHKTTAAGEQFYGSAAVYDGAIYIQGYTGILYAFNGSGTQLWSTQLGDIGFSGPVVVNGVIYVESGDSVYALNTSGAILWSTATADPIQSNSVAVVNGKVFAVSQDGDLHALNASTGTEIWSYPILSNDANSSTPAVADGIVYVGSANDTFYALRASTGVLIWSATTGGEIVGSPAVAGGVVYIASLDGYLYAFNAADGTTVWKVPLPNGAASEGPVTIADGVVYVGDHQGNVDAFGAQDGQFLLAVGGTGSWVFAQPVVVNGMLYVSSYADDNLYAFAPGGAGANTVPSLSAAPDITSLHPDLRLVPVR
jgi:outer membrane protein assembly factor BamB